VKRRKLEPDIDKMKKAKMEEEENKANTFNCKDKRIYYTMIMEMII
jgi:hypothetical protein